MATSSNELRFDSRAILVTGAGRGIGRQHALYLASRGAKVVVNDNGCDVEGEGTSREPADSVVREITSAGGEAVANYDSIANAQGGEYAIEAALDSFGRLDAVVHNAGILTQATVEELSDAQVRAMVDTHLVGAFNVTRPAIRVMRNAGYGRLVYASSNSGIIGISYMAHYGAAKMGLVGLVRCLASEVKDFNFRANAYGPNASTRMADGLDPRLLKVLDDNLGDFGAKVVPEVIPPLIAYLAHEECSVSGETFSTVAGRVSRFFIGLTEGFYSDSLSAEDVRDHIGEIMDTDGYTIPRELVEDLTQAMRRAQSVNA